MVHLFLLFQLSLPKYQMPINFVKIEFWIILVKFSEPAPFANPAASN
jgi:hypothetical protein